MDKNIIRFELRLPPKLHKKVVKVAERERRSIHSQLLIYVEQGLDKDAPKK